VSGKKKKGAELIPQHPDFLSQIKGITGRIVDSDFLLLSDNSYIFVIAEEQNKFRIFSFKSLENVAENVLQLEG